MLTDQELKQAAEKLRAFQVKQKEQQETLSQMLEQYGSLLENYKRLKSDFEEERDARERYKQLARGQERNPFVLVLVDGDGYVFDDNLLRAGTDGGKQAAKMLNDTVKNSLRYRGLEHCRTMVRIYANLSGLSKACCKAGLCGPEKRSLAPFVAAFNRSADLTDFVDAGELKENADFKIRAMFRLYADNVQCRHIFFAGCTDVGFISELQPHMGNRDRITLIKTAAFHPEFNKLGLGVEVFPSLFRTVPLDVQDFQQKPPKPSAIVQANSKPAICTFYQKGKCAFGKNCKFQHVKAASISEGGDARDDDVLDRVSDSPTSSEEEQTKRSANDRNHSPARSLTSHRNSSIPITHGVTAVLNSPDAENSGSPLWTGSTITPTRRNPIFTAGQRNFIGVDPAKQQATFESTLPHVIPPGKIAVNKDGHRLDAYLPHPTPEDRSAYYARVGIQKLCNNHLLNGYCDKGPSCEFDHSPVSPGIRNVLNLLVHETPCAVGGPCRNTRCQFGHICQKADCALRGGQSHCKLRPEHHVQDLQVAEYV
jgi:hypothetical protein